MTYSQQNYASYIINMDLIRYSNCFLRIGRSLYVIVMGHVNDLLKLLLWNKSRQAGKAKSQHE